MTTEATRPLPTCFICGASLRVSITHSKKGKVAVALTCPTDGRHLRAFCNHRPFVEEVVARVETDEAALQKHSKTQAGEEDEG
ncbi:MAG: hypothetical protein M0031_03920 [Thermaerobacter sp.]|jgi:hypothetical protein|nr:hypothetical protein [Thermaerobacter sp.]